MPTMQKPSHLSCLQKYEKSTDSAMKCPICRFECTDVHSWDFETDVFDSDDENYNPDSDDSDEDDEDDSESDDGNSQSFEEEYESDSMQSATETDEESDD